MKKRLYIETVGCQMNMLDSELVVAGLRRQGYELVQTPAEADTILFNTCSVRERAEEKIYSHLGRLRELKQRHPEKIIGVLGCMAQNHKELVFKRAPYVDLVVGPGQLHQVPLCPESATTPYQMADADWRIVAMHLRQVFADVVVRRNLALVQKQSDASTGKRLCHRSSFKHRGRSIRNFVIEIFRAETF